MSAVTLGCEWCGVCERAYRPAVNTSAYGGVRVTTFSHICTGRTDGTYVAPEPPDITYALRGFPRWADEAVR